MIKVMSSLLKKFCNILLNLQTKRPAIIVLIFILTENSVIARQVDDLAGRDTLSWPTFQSARVYLCNAGACLNIAV